MVTAYLVIGLLLFARWSRWGPIGKVAYVAFFPLHAAVGCWIGWCYREWKLNGIADNKAIWTVALAILAIFFLAGVL